MSNSDFSGYAWHDGDYKLPCGHTAARLLPIHAEEMHPLQAKKVLQHLTVCWCGATYETEYRLGQGERGYQVSDEAVQAGGEDYGYSNRN